MPNRLEKLGLALIGTGLVIAGYNECQRIYHQQTPQPRGVNVGQLSFRSEEKNFLDVVGTTLMVSGVPLFIGGHVYRRANETHH
jgi:hypothetical protein